MAIHAGAEIEAAMSQTSRRLIRNSIIYAAGIWDAPTSRSQ
jgi:hypothetical protein